MKSAVNAFHSLLAPSAALLLVISLLFSGVSMGNAIETETPNQGHADYGHYVDISSLVDRADTVVEGSVISSTSDVTINVSLNPDRPFELSYTVLEINVSDVMKGDLDAGETIQIKYPADADAPSVGEQGFFFLEDYRDIIADMPFSPVNPTRSFTAIVNGQVELPEGITVASPYATSSANHYDAVYIKELICGALQ